MGEKSQSRRPVAVLVTLAIAVGVAVWVAGSGGASRASDQDRPAAKDPRHDGADRAVPDEPTTEARAPGATARVFLEVTDEDRAPIVAAHVEVKDLHGTAARARTDDSGVAELQLGPGVRVAVSALGFAPQTFIPPRFPGPDAAWTVTLKRPAAAGQDAVKAYGALLSPTGAVHDGTVAFLQAGTLVAAARADKSGRFAVPDVDFDVAHAVSAAHGERRQDRAEGLVLALPGGGTLSGRVQGPDGAAIDGANVRAVPQMVSDARRALFAALPKKDKALRESLRRSLSSLTYAVEARTGQGEDAPGTFVLGPVAAGPLTLLAAHKEGYIPDDKEGLSARSGEEVSGLVFTLKGAPQLVGRITDAATGAAVPGARVQVEFVGGLGLPDFGRARAGADGRYALSVHPDTLLSVVVDARGYRGYREGGLAVEDGGELEKNFALTKLQKGDRRRTMDYVGLGTVVKKVDDGILVQELVDGGGAAEVLGPGDVILRADGVWLDELGLQEAVQILLGEEGSEVELLVKKHAAPEGEQEQLVTLERQRIKYQR